ncbi:MAG: hypothetical protein J0I77_17930 [Rudaea sp.]|uniref:hypothetical protein n=1 Tax=unclassified Rudaea TaxID=2627037 RepID=UPI0010F4B8B4|nr:MULTISPECIES: hypothetical protein [unclassified Rudaea]MBN8887609.1 hypothetical protein [Rudaea sp.]
MSISTEYFQTLAQVFLARRDANEDREDDLMAVLDVLWYRMNRSEREAVKVVSERISSGKVSEIAFANEMLSTRLFGEVADLQQFVRVATDTAMTFQAIGRTFSMLTAARPPQPSARNRGDAVRFCYAD